MSLSPAQVWSPASFFNVESGAGLFLFIDDRTMGEPMTGDRRDGTDRRDEISDPITLGEVYRLCERIEKQMSELSEGIERDVHTLRNKCEANNLALELLKLRMNALESKGRDWRGWIASGVIGAALALIPLLLNALRHP